MTFSNENTTTTFKKKKTNIININIYLDLESVEFIFFKIIKHNNTLVVKFY